MIETHIHPPPEPCELTVERRDDGVSLTLAVHGDVDLASAPVLARELKGAVRPQLAQIVLDLAGLRFIDSRGINLLVDAQERAHRNGHLLVLTNVPENAQRLFTITGLDGHFVIQ